MHHNVGVVLELPVRCQARNEALFPVGAVVEEYQGLMGVFQDNVVDLVLLPLKIRLLISASVPITSVSL